MSAGDVSARLWTRDDALYLDITAMGKIIGPFARGRLGQALLKTFNTFIYTKAAIQYANTCIRHKRKERIFKMTPVCKAQRAIPILCTAACSARICLVWLKINL